LESFSKRFVSEKKREKNKKSLTKSCKERFTYYLCTPKTEKGVQNWKGFES
jgi:hypothetical protein